jgi:hypothetical protein
MKVDSSQIWMKEQLPLYGLLGAIALIVYLAIPQGSTVAAAPNEGGKDLPAYKVPEDKPKIELTREYFYAPWHTPQLGAPLAGKNLADEMLPPRAVAARRSASGVTGIFIDDNSRWAFVDGKLVKEGEKLGGARVEKILPDRILFRKAGRIIVRRAKDGSGPGVADRAAEETP